MVLKLSELSVSFHIILKFVSCFNQKKTYLNLFFINILAIIIIFNLFI